ncbi:GTP-binding protein [Streptomyces sp. NPDC056708]|uniref:GTP-binding protein n=1 Tax=unclassified Streptomyces TaxID=2593676 RepID=UPI003680F03E
MFNLGVLAHVDAGKTSLTERLLFECGAIRHIGSVDEDTTQTDSNAIERARALTVRAAVACFRGKDLQFNLVDAPGHADFVAEVERGPMAVDTVILVPSAPEGVQPQIGALYRVIERLRLPVVVFVNKLDCVGAAGPEVLDELSGKPGLLPLAMGVPVDPRTPETGFAPAELPGADIRRRWAERLAENDEKLLEQLVADRCPGRAELRAQTNAGLLQPVVFGSSITGAGMDGLLHDADQAAQRLRSAEDHITITVQPDTHGTRQPPGHGCLTTSPRQVWDSVPSTTKASVGQ